MYKIEYEIGLNEQGRPYIGLPDDYEQRPEDRFFAIEIARYILADLLIRRVADIDEETAQKVDDAEQLLGQLGDNVAEILYDLMRANAATTKMFRNPFDVLVNSIEERDALPDKDILYDEKIFDREIEFKVAVQTYNEETFLPEKEIYELQNGITNEHWVKL